MEKMEIEKVVASVKTKGQSQPVKTKGQSHPMLFASFSRNQNQKKNFRT
jgi:hypothetical protein